VAHSPPEAELDARVRAEVAAVFVATGAAPTALELAVRFSVDAGAIDASLRRLAARRSLELRAGDGPATIVTAYPFSAAPTPFWVEHARGGHWAPCAWCALGVAALVGGAARILTRAGLEAAPLTLTVDGSAVDGSAVDGSAVTPVESAVHFAVPAAEWGADMGWACRTITAFARAEDVDPWCARHRIPRGEVLPLAQAHALAHAFFSDGLRPEAHQRRRRDVEAIFASVGLSGAFWSL
jgi:hypothetical protein